mmetsp:Transcript_39186/g.97074  ORF Transcript_39186/g.97074 Transcript_39186/m.97074 type:complete len:140 (+) Transcript_39186:75-494(+)|eukprot:CAMPEP_0197591234 /NCGR_PEP_ID=MMETSP1326-20131121/12959_1 /TAXON_ID=1155430 /ORGANISM="Genus nov. species nov., Strain RCC2288" /LENGTH=139 /DNA_ID=CAMNT_0043156625 /DNA_START=74 /DNA_END=493 /DNA_ORIENTATION=-
MSGKWSTGLFDCCSDCETMCIPDGVLLGQQNRIVQSQEFCTFPCCCYGVGVLSPYSAILCDALAACMCIGPNRTAMKQKLGIQEADCAGDCCCSFLCTSCVLCQMGRELKARGIFTMEQMNGQLPSTLAPSNMSMTKQR